MVKQIVNRTTWSDKTERDTCALIDIFVYVVMGGHVSTMRFKTNITHEIIMGSYFHRLNCIQCCVYDCMCMNMIIYD